MSPPKELPRIIQLFSYKRSLLPVDIDKRGLLKWREFQERKMTLEELQEYANAPAWAHITGKVSGLFTIDIDPSGIAWSKEMHLYELAHRRTPSGGLHIDVELPSWPVKNTVSVLSKGIDTRGEGGIALIWGRTRKGAYEWLTDWWAEKPLLPYNELPLWVREQLYAKCQKEDRVTTLDFSRIRNEDADDLLLRALSRAPIRGRNDSGFWLACRLRDAGISKEAARLFGHQYANRVFDTNTHGKHEQYTTRMFDAALDNAYSRTMNDN